MRKALSGIVLITALQGCTTASDVLSNKYDGVHRIYRVSQAEAYQLAHLVFAVSGADNIEDRKSENLVVAKFGATAFSWGAFAGAWIDPIDATRTRVTVVSKRKVATNVSTPFTEIQFHERFAQELSRMQVQQEEASPRSP